MQLCVHSSTVHREANTMGWDAMGYPFLPRWHWSCWRWCLLSYTLSRLLCTSPGSGGQPDVIKIRTVRGFIFSTPVMAVYKHAKPPIFLYRWLKTKTCQIIVEEKNLCHWIHLNSLKHSFRRGPRWSATASGTLCCTNAAAILTSAPLSVRKRNISTPQRTQLSLNIFRHQNRVNKTYTGLRKLDWERQFLISFFNR